MKWIKIYNKYKDTELMKEFCRYIHYEKVQEKPLKTHEQTVFAYIKYWIIKDIWGYLKCFAEMKGIEINVMMVDNVMEGWVGKEMQGFEQAEQAMCWCAEKFFKEIK